MLDVRFWFGLRVRVGLVRIILFIIDVRVQRGVILFISF
jgi:hypothetical protein